MPEPAASLSGWKTSSRTTELAVHRRPLCREMCWTKLMSVLDVKDDDDNAKQLCSNLAALADLYRLKVRSDELSPLPLPANRHQASSLCLISTKHTKGSKGCPISPASRMHPLLTRLIILADVIILDIGLCLSEGFNLHLLDDTRNTRSAKLKPRSMTSIRSKIDEKPHLRFFQKFSVILNKT
jgi:hypothetical protein